MAAIIPFSDEQLRLLVNLQQRYEVWIEAERLIAALPYDLRRKEVGVRAYLYEIYDRGGNGRSLGPWSDNKEKRLEAYRAEKTALKARRETSWAQVTEACRLYRALRLPMLASEAGAILREYDRRGWLGSHLMVVGTNAMSAYAVEAGGRIADAPDETEDFDLAWIAKEAASDVELIWTGFKAVDATYSINSERPYQARNAKAYEVEMLAAPSRIATLGRRDKPRPVPLPEQEWLLLGRPVDHIVACRDATPARIVAPDPRWFALQKLWLAKKPTRSALKRPKDARQGRSLLAAACEAMPLHPVDVGFGEGVPEELREVWAEWLDAN